jgi:DNA-binding NtrC family response regulator
VETTLNGHCPKQVLVVDDEPLIRWSLSETLGDAGHIVKSAGDARETMATLEGGFHPDVVLLDFRLPDSDDLGLLANVIRLAPHTPVIMMTAFGTQEIRAGAVKLGAYRVIDKPVDMEEMLALVRGSLDSPPPPAARVR